MSADDFARLVKELHDRLDDWADDDMCPRAEQQLDGQRAAVENAVTYAELIEIRAHIP